MEVGYDQDFDTAETFDDVSYWEDYDGGGYDESDAEASPVAGED